MNYKPIVLIMWLLTITVSIQAQSIYGFVKDEYNQSIHDAYIVNIKSGEHSHSNGKGEFSLEHVFAGDSILITKLGYKQTIYEIYEFGKPIEIILSESPYNLTEVLIKPEIDAMNLFTEVVLHANPVNSSQEILQQVPGLFIGQHAGGGKAEQIFMRGFDIDHGTDVNIEIDGLPVNMVSHAHGQGYADLHFIIPETVDKIGFGKGAYYADKGNFSTAGYVDFRTKDKLKESLVSIESGMFNTQRLLALNNLANKESYSAYIASEYILSDGAFDSPQNFSRINLMGKLSGKLSQTSTFSVLTSYFKSAWDASGQIPNRAIDAGLIGRFGAIDDTEGGFTSRANILLTHSNYISEKAFVNSKVYYTKYDFDLYSNFTFFLNDPVNGDQIKQTESRNIFGASSKFNFEQNLFNSKVVSQLGVSVRNDQTTDSELSHTVNRVSILDQIKLGNVNENNFAAFAKLDFQWGKFSINPAIRADIFKFIYTDKLQEEYFNEAVTNAIISPKLNLLYNSSNTLQVYFKAGKGFHSNDTRVVINKSGKQTLPASYGADLGFIWKPIPSLIINTAIWNLYLEQEFIYVGDEGVVEPGGETLRKGVDFSTRYQPAKYLFLNFDANYAIPESMKEPEGTNYLPLAPTLTMQGGIHVVQQKGIFGSLNFRHMANRPANEDNSIVANGYTVIDANFGYQFKNFDFEIQIQNLLNTKWNETQFATESRLIDENEPVEEIHFIPGTPLFAKAKITFRF